MAVVGHVESLWRYPVKSMRGEALDEAFMGFSGVYGDRCFAFKSLKSVKGFPYLTGREQEQMLRYRPQFRFAAKAAKPPNLAEAMSLAPGINPVDADPEDMIVDVTTPSGEVLANDDPALILMLGEEVAAHGGLTLMRSNRALTDCRPVSLISVQTVAQLGEEMGTALDGRRFRANVYVDFASEHGFGEDALVGRSLRIGQKAIVAILERDPRCKMISLDPDTGEHNPQVLRKVAKAHDGRAGVYCAVTVEGTLERGDSVELLD
jgi:uncharacterized protein YcbX